MNALSPESNRSGNRLCLFALIAFFGNAGLLVAGPETQPSFAIERVNLTSAGAEYVESFDVGNPSISANGRYVAFTSQNALVPGDTNGYLDVYVRDRQSGTTTLVSVTHLGGISDMPSSNPVISADGSAVAFVSPAGNLVSGDTNNAFDVFVRDLAVGTTTRVSVGTGNVQGIGASGLHTRAAISDNGRYVTFYSAAANLVAGDTNARDDIFRHDRVTGSTVRISIATGGTESDAHCIHPAISGDGSKVAFVSNTNQFGGNPQFRPQVWLRDVTLSTTELITKDGVGTAGNGSSYFPVLSFDGRYVAFESGSTNLVTPAGGADAVFRRDRQTGQNVVVSLTVAGGYASATRPAISADGRYVAFGSTSGQLVLGDTNSRNDIFIRDLLDGKTGIASRTSTALQSNLDSHDPAIAGSTLEVVFRSTASNLVPGDTNAAEDLFVSTPVFPSSILINEVDAVTTNGRQFIELYDGGVGNSSLTGLVVVLYDGATDTSYGAFDLDGYSTGADGYFVIGTASVPGVDLIADGGFLQTGVDAVALYHDNAAGFPNGTAVTVNRLRDAVVHENNHPGDSGLLALLHSSQPQADEAANGRADTESVQRLPNGAGLPGVTGVYQAYIPSPGGPNGVPASLELAPASDTGISNSDGITNDATPTITGLAPAGANVVLVSNLSGVVGNATATGSGSWSITPSSALTEGDHLFTASADGGPASAPLAVTLDTTVPAAPGGLALAAASDTGASSADRITSDNTPTINGSAEAEARVALVSNLDGNIGSADSSGVWSIDAGTLRDGAHQLTATATDPAGNLSPASAVLGVTIDTAGPTVTVDKASGQADPTDSTPVGFTAVFNESVTGLLASDFELSGSAVPGGASLSGGPSTYTFSVGSTAGEGTIIVALPAAAATDLAGNPSFASTAAADNLVEFDIHGGDTGSATAIALGGWIGSSEGWLGLHDADVFSFTLTEARRVVVFTRVSSVDTWGILRNAGGDQLNNPANDDDLGDDANFRTEITLAAGTYTIEVTGKGATPTGAYGIEIDATGEPSGRPDVLVGTSLAAAAGDDLYGPGQVLALVSKKAKPVSGLFAVANDGDIADRFTLQAGAGNSLFAVTYTNAVDGNVTAALLTGTARTDEMAPGDPPYVVNVRVVPNQRKLVVKKRVGKRIVTQVLKKSILLPFAAESELDMATRDNAAIRVQTK